MNYQFWKDFVLYFFGTTDFALILVNFIFGCVGTYVMILLDIMTRDKTAKGREAFKFKIFWKENQIRFLLNFFIMLVCIRFSADFVGQPPTPKTSLVIGFMSDVIVIMVKKRKQKFKEDNENGDKFTIKQIDTKETTIEQTPAPATENLQ